MRQVIVRLVLLVLVLLVIFGVYRLLTVDTIDAGEFFDSAARPLIMADPAASTSDAGGALAEVARAHSGTGTTGFYLPVVLDPAGELVEGIADAGESQPASLSELLAQFPDVRFVVALREPNLQSLAALLHAVDSQGARGRVLAMVDDQQLMDTLRSQAPDLATGMTTAEAASFLLTARLSLTPFYRPSAPALVLPASDFSPRIAKAAHSRGIATLVQASYDDRAAVDELIAQGADGVILGQ